MTGHVILFRQSVGGHSRSLRGYVDRSGTGADRSYLILDRSADVVDRLRDALDRLSSVTARLSFIVDRLSPVPDRSYTKRDWLGAGISGFTDRLRYILDRL